MIVLEGDQPLGADAHHYYDGLIKKLERDTSHVQHVQDFWGRSAEAAGSQSGEGRSGQRKRTFNVARPKILRPSDFAPTMTTPVRVSGSSDLIRPLNSMSAPPAAGTMRAGTAAPRSG